MSFHDQFSHSVASDEYDPLKAGSIDCTDLRPHDRAICRALDAKHIPPKQLKSKPYCSIFVGRLPLDITEDEIFTAFDRVASVRSVKVVRDIVTGMCRGYAFVELKHERDVMRVLHKCKGISFGGKEALVDREVGRTLKGWVPRRLGGGWGGRKEAGQLRFGCVDRPWRRPILGHKKRNDQEYEERHTPKKYTDLEGPSHSLREHSRNASDKKRNSSRSRRS